MRAADRAEIRASIETLLADAEQARAEYDAWMAAWRARRGHVNGFDRDTGLPTRALAGQEGA